MVEINVGDTIAVDFEITGPEVRALEFEVLFNPALLNFSAEEYGNFFDDETIGLKPTTNNVVFGTFSNAAGAVLNLQQAIVGAAGFTAIAAGECILSWSKAMQLDDDLVLHSEAPVLVNSDNIQVTPGPLPVVRKFELKIRIV